MVAINCMSYCLFYVNKILNDDIMDMISFRLIEQFPMILNHRFALVKTIEKCIDLIQLVKYLIIYIQLF